MRQDTDSSAVTLRGTQPRSSVGLGWLEPQSSGGRGKKRGTFSPRLFICQVSVCVHVKRVCIYKCVSVMYKACVYILYIYGGLCIKHVCGYVCTHVEDRGWYLLLLLSTLFETQSH